jgi:MFS family permease
VLFPTQAQKRHSHCSPSHFMPIWILVCPVLFLLPKLVFGISADYVGRRVTFIATLAIITFSSLLGAVCFDTGAFSIYHQLAICLFIRGLGVGGKRRKKKERKNERK